MSTSRRSSQSTRSTVTARSNRPPTWRATSLIATVPGPPLIVSKNSSAPEVSMVTAEPETISASASAASQLAPTIPKGSRLISSSSVDGRLRAERRNSTKTRLQDVFPTEDSGEGGSNTEAGASFPSGSKVDTDPNVVSPSTSSPALLESTDENDQPFPSTSAETTPVLHIPPVQPEHEPLSSSSPNQASWFGSFGRSKGKERAVDVNATTTSFNSVQDTTRLTSKSLSAPPRDEGIVNAESLSSAIETLGIIQESYANETIRSTTSSPVAELQTPRAEVPQLVEDLSKTIRVSEGPKHSWFNPFAPYPSRSQNIGSQSHTSQPSSSPSSPSTPSTSRSPLRGASSSYVGSIDDEVPGLLRTPALSDDEDGQEVQQETNHLHSTLAPANGSATDTKDETPPTSTPSQRKRLDSLNSLNPSTSRFSISIPLLGRPKMRLEDAVKRGKEVEDKEVKETRQENGTASAHEATLNTVVSSVTATPLISNPSSPSDLLTTTTTTTTTTSTIAEAGQPDSAEHMSIPSPPQSISEEVTTEIRPSLTSVSQTEEEPETTPRVDSSTGHADITNPPAQSWWSYIGWSSSQPNVTRMEDPLPELKIESNEDSAPNLDTTQVQPIVSLPERSTSAPPVMGPSDPIVEPTEGKIGLHTETPSIIQSQAENPAPAKAPSIFSLDAARAAGSWFNPWAWYGYDATERSSLNPAGPVTILNGGTEESGNVVDNRDGNEDDGDDKMEKTEMTESEKIKEAALARDRPPDIASSSITTTTTQDDTSTVQTSSSTVVSEGKSYDLRPTNVDPINPIADSASYMRSGWASFFSSRGRGLTTKNLNDVAVEIEGAKDDVRRDENGIEIMDLTDDEAGNVNVNVQEPGSESESEKDVTKVPVSTALTLMRALAGHDMKKRKAIEAPKDEKNQVEENVSNTNGKLPVLPSSPNPSTNASKYNVDVLSVASVPASPTKVLVSRPGRASSVSTTQTTNSVNTKPAPPLTISDDLKASVAAAKKGRRSGVSPGNAGAAGPSSLPKDSISTPPSGTDGLKKEKEKSKPANKSGTSTPAPPPPPNLVLPTWEDTFHTLPRSWIPEQYLPVSNNTTGGLGTTIGKTMRYISGVLLGADNGYISSGESSRSSASASATKRRSRRGSTRRMSISGENAIPGGSGVGSEAELIARERQKLRELLNWGHNLPRAWELIDTAIENRKKAAMDKKGKVKAMIGQEEHRIDVTRGCKKVVVIGIHGWFPGAVMRSMLGEPTGTSPKFVNMMEQALEEFQSAHGVKFNKVTKIPLEGEGTIDRRVEKLYSNLLSNESWVDDLHNADVIFVATHSQGSVVSTHLLDRLIRDRHIRTAKNAASEPISDMGINLLPLPPQRICCLCLCGIHLGPLRYLSSSSLLQPYIQYFESAAARELFEFQDTESDVSRAYVQALRNVLFNEIKMVYVASLNDQVVPIYSGLFTSACHPLILRALYIDGDAYHSSDFLTNLLVLLLRVLNCGLSDSGLLAHLSEATAGSLSGIGHSTAYEELSTFSLAVNYLFLTNNGFEDHRELTVDHFNASHEMNDYEIPWALRDLIADEKVTHHFSREITQLRDVFRNWHPKTTILRDIKRKLQPIQRLPTTSTPGTANNASKL